jgi:hypothetical protein
MLETYRFVGIFATMLPPTQWVPEDPSPGKVVTILKLRIYLTPPISGKCSYTHTPPYTITSYLFVKKENHVTCAPTFTITLLYYLIFVPVFLILTVTSYYS